jgi:hypothetical protein
MGFVPYTKKLFPFTFGERAKKSFFGTAVAAETVQHVAERVEGKSVLAEDMRGKLFEVFALYMRKSSAFAADEVIMPLSRFAVFSAEHPAGRLTFAAVKAAGKPFAFQLFEGAINRRLTDGLSSFFQLLGDFEGAVMPPPLLFEKGEDKPALFCHI